MVGSIYRAPSACDKALQKEATKSMTGVIPKMYLKKQA